MKKWYKLTYVDKTRWILDNIGQLNCSPNEVLLLLIINYLNESRSLITFEILQKKTNLNETEVDQAISLLCAKSYLNIRASNQSLDFCLEGLFESEVEKKEVAMNQSLFDLFESEFGRPLNQKETELIIDWMKRFDSKLVMYALKEASLYKSVNIRYVEKVLQDWEKHGYTAEMIEEGKHIGRKSNS